MDKVGVFEIPPSVLVHIALIFQRTNQLLLPNATADVTSKVVGMASEGGGVTLYDAKGVRLSDISE